jgi:TRAP-type C4-dicarboxylate transport system permease small subunit
MRAIARWHDASTELGAAIASLCVAATAIIYTAEVVARYFFNDPLNWSGDVSSYLLCVTAFLALPKVTRESGHVAITYFLERADEAGRARYVRALQQITGLVCLATAVFIAVEGAQLFDEGVLTTQATQIPKWLIAAFACFGLASSSLHLFFADGDVVGKDAGL